jgi:hypothetical protein
VAETDWLIEAKTAYERGNAYAAAAAALIDIATRCESRTAATKAPSSGPTSRTSAPSDSEWS